MCCNADSKSSMCVQVKKIIAIFQAAYDTYGATTSLNIKVENKSSCNSQEVCEWKMRNVESDSAGCSDFNNLYQKRK